jgi:hypothetical protein
MGKYVLLGLIALTAAVFMMGSCEGLVDVVKDLDNIDDDDNNDGDDSVTHEEMPEDGDWIEIATVANFQKIGNSNYTDYPLNGKYWQTADITITSDDNYTPIGKIDGTKIDYGFTGTFNGNNYKITADSLTYDSVFSFFGTTNGAELKNIHIEGSITETGGSSSAYLSSIATFAKDTIITHCSNAATLTGTGIGYVGGIVGRLSGNSSIDDCTNSGNIASKGGSTGGIVAFYTSGANVVVKNCSNTGDIVVEPSSSTFDVGGIVSYTAATYTIIACKNSGKITFPSFGGSSPSYVGGIVGNAASSATSGSTLITACYNTGDIVVTGIQQSEKNQYACAGGIAGNAASVTNVISVSYSIGNIIDQTTANADSTKYTPQFGGIIGRSAGASGKENAIPADCYWKNVSSVINNGIGAKGINGNVNFQTSNEGCTQFSGTAPTGIGWNLGHDFENNQYWASLGNGSTTFPKLWWEE